MLIQFFQSLGTEQTVVYLLWIVLGLALMEHLLRKLTQDWRTRQRLKHQACTYRPFTAGRLEDGRADAFGLTLAYGLPLPKIGTYVRIQIDVEVFRLYRVRHVQIHKNLSFDEDGVEICAHRIPQIYVAVHEHLSRELIFRVRQLFGNGKDTASEELPLVPGS